MANLIAAAVVIAIVGGAIAYIVREKKRGALCVGCPHAKACGAQRASRACACTGCAESRSEEK